MDISESFDSKEEYYFNLWLDELSRRGLVEYSKYHPKPFILSDTVHLSYQKQLKTKIKDEQAHLFGSHEYQADWIIFWNERLKGIFFFDSSIPGRSPTDFPFIVNWSENRRSFFSVIDVKGTFNQNDAYRRFSIEQKWVWQKFGIYVQKIIPMPTNKEKPKPAGALFLTTFMPVRATLTDIKAIDKKLKYKYKLIDEFMSEHGL